MQTAPPTRLQHSLSSISPLRWNRNTGSMEVLIPHFSFVVHEIYITG